MEDNSLPPTQLVRPKDASESLDITDVNAPVSSYSSAPSYPIESLEVHSEGSSSPTVTVTAPTIRSVPFSRRRATLVSLTITSIVVLITAVSAIAVIRRIPNDQKNAQTTVPTQDVSVNDALSSVPPELQGSEEALLVNGDIVTRGVLKVKSDAFVTVLKTAPLTANQTISLPNASGTVCLDSNNCNLASTAQVTQVQNQINQLSQTIPQPFDGVSSINGQNGSITIQGSINRVSVNTADGVMTFTTPQDLDANANVQFGSLAVNAAGQIVANTLTHTGTGINLSLSAGTDAIIFTDGGRNFQFPAGGLASQEICTNQGNCGGGGGSVSSVNAMTGAITIQGTANQINVANGAGTITLSTPQDIATTSNPQFNNLTLTGQADIAGHAAIGNNANVGATTALNVVEAFSSSCPFNCTSIFAHTIGQANSNQMTAILTRVEMTNGALSAIGLYATSNIISGSGAIGDNYGVLIASQTAGVNDYGLYVAGADTYSIWVDSGLSRFDGGLEVQGANPITLEGATDNTFETTLAVVDPTADRTITLPNQSGTVCLDSGNCIGGSGGAPNAANYLVTALDGTLTNERALLAGANIAFTDGGAGGSFTVATVQNPTFTTSVTTPLLTSTGAFSLTPGGAMTLGSTGQTALLQGTTTTITSNGAGNDITLTSPDLISLNAGGIDINNVVAIGNTGGPIGIAAVAIAHDLNAINCQAYGCYGILNLVSATNVSGLNTGVTGVYSRVDVAAGSLTRAAGFMAGNAIGVGTLTDNYGLYVEDMTKGTNDYGIYIGGADTYALWVDSGISRFDGNLEFEGVTDDAFEFTLTVADPTADRTYTIPNSSAATDTFCLVSLGNCAGSGGGVTGSGTNNRDANVSATSAVTSGTAYAFDATHASASGLSIDIQSSGSGQNALLVTSNNGATTGLDGLLILG